MSKACTKCGSRSNEKYEYANWCKPCFAEYRVERKARIKKQGGLPLFPSRKKTERQKYMSAKEWMSFEEKIKDEKERLFWTLIAMTGLRLREALAVKYDDIDPDHFLLHVPTFKRRGRPVLDVDLPPKLTEQLCALQSKGKLFEELNAMMAWRHFKTIARKAGLNSRYSPHALRHMQGMITAEVTGGDPFKVKARLRHASIKTSEGYVHLLPELRMKLSREIWGKLEKEKPS